MKIKLNCEVEIFVMNIAAVLNQPVEKYLPLFSVARQEKILRYKFNADRNRTVWAELLARYVISKKLSLPMEKIVIDRDENGKSYIIGNLLEISLSHSRNWVACSFGEFPNGVDIENDSRDALEIAKNFFTADEYKNLCALNGEERNLQFLKYWTLKESRFKCIGDINPNENLLEKNFLLEDGTVAAIAVLNLAF